jgi:hypothetical protein
VAIFEDDALWLTVTTAAVKPANAIATAVKTTTKYFGALAVAILLVPAQALYIKT